MQKRGSIDTGGCSRSTTTSSSGTRPAPQAARPSARSGSTRERLLFFDDDTCAVAGPARKPERRGGLGASSRNESFVGSRRWRRAGGDGGSQGGDGGSQGGDGGSQNGDGRSQDGRGSRGRDQRQARADQRDAGGLGADGNAREPAEVAQGADRRRPARAGAGEGQGRRRRGRRRQRQDPLRAQRRRPVQPGVERQAVHH